MAEKTSHLSICLIKEGINDHADIIENGCQDVDIDGVGTFYTLPSYAHPPDWMKRFFKNKLPADLEIVSATARGVLVASVTVADKAYVFAITFGHGRHLLMDDVIEERFGLKVVLNSVQATSLRSIDKLNLGSFSKQSREQIGREGEAANFGIDIEQDLVRAVTGRSKVPAFGKMISGRDAFVISAKFDVDDVADVLAKCVTQFHSTDYKESFDWIDQLKDVRSSSVLADLNAELVANIQAGQFGRMWMAPPDIVNWSDVTGFKYQKPKQGDLHEDLDIPALVASAGDQAITLEWLQGTRVYVISAKDDDETHQHWRTFDCIYAEVVLGGTLHVLNAGKWYEVADDFTAAVNTDFNAIPNSDLAVPPYAHGNEGDYNIALAQHLPNSACLDADMIAHGGGKSTIEFCDVYTPNHQLIHVKRYSGSSQLSHLFSQGAVSAELFAQDPSFREKVNGKLPVHLKLQDTAPRPPTGDYEIVYGIISRSDNPLDIPFFSKVTIRNATRALGGMGYKFSKLKIPVAA